MAGGVDENDVEGKGARRRAPSCHDANTFGTGNGRTGRNPLWYGLPQLFKMAWLVSGRWDSGCLTKSAHFTRNPDV